MSNLQTRRLINGANGHNVRKCHCFVCGQYLAPREGYSAPLASNGGRNRYVCHECYSGWNNHTYGEHAHAEARGKQSKAGLTYSVELETRRPDALMRAELAAVEFIATEDCTTDTEFKMAPRGNLNNAKTWSTIEKLLREGHAAITYTEGTHIHVGHGTVEIKDEDGNPTPDLINARTMRQLRMRCHTMLEPLIDEMQANPEAVVRVFGRWFHEEYAAAKVSDIDRYSAINVTNKNTIEYRLPRFRTAAQYRACLKLCAELTKTIVTNYMQYAAAEPTNYAKLDHKAKITAAKLVKVWQKLSPDAPEWTDVNGETNEEVSARVR